MKRAAAILLVIGAIAGLGSWFFLRNHSYDNTLTARGLAARQLAEYLAQKYPGQRALLISNPFTENDATAKEIIAMERAGIAGIRKGLGDKVILEALAYPELKAGARANPRGTFIDGETTTPLSYLVASDAFDKLAAQHPACDLMVSLIGLPADLRQARCWQSDKPSFALLLPDLRFVGDAAAVKRAVQRGKLAAFVLHKPGAPDLDTPLKGSGEFDQRFLLVTPENVERMVADYPQVFPAN